MDSDKSSFLAHFHTGLFDWLQVPNLVTVTLSVQALEGKNQFKPLHTGLPDTGVTGGGRASPRD